MNKLKNILKWLREKDAGKITYKIDCMIKNVESTCNQAQNNNGNNGAINDTIRIELLNEIRAFYIDQNNYTDIELVQHKQFLCSQRKGFVERFWYEFYGSYKSTITAVLSVFFTMLFISSGPIDSEDLENINALSLSGYVSICVFAIWIVLTAIISIISSFLGYKYRKYEIIEYELTIIDMLQEKYNEKVRQSVENHLIPRRPNNNGTPWSC